MMYDSVIEFLATAEHAESKIKSHGLSYEHNEVVRGTQDRRSREMWVALKTVSHFNLHIALEVLLKLSVWLLTKRAAIPKGHELTELYDQLGESVKSLFQEYYDAAQQKADPDDYHCVAFRNTESPIEGDAFEKKRSLQSLRETFEYLDEDAQLHLKRYSYEQVEKREWRHYLSDISVFAEFIRDVSDDIQNCEGIFHPPG